MELKLSWVHKKGEDAGKVIRIKFICIFGNFNRIVEFREIIFSNYFVKIIETFQIADIGIVAPLIGQPDSVF